MSDPLGAFTAQQRRRGLAAATIDRRRRVLLSFRCYLNPRALTDATESDINAWLDGCALTNASRYTYISHVATFYAFAVKAGLCDGNPTEDLDRPRLPRRVPRPISDGDLAMALEAADDRMRTWLSLAAYAGLRCKEIALLRRQDVLDDHDPPLLIVNDGKGGHQAVLPLHPDVLAALRVFGMPARGWLFRMGDGRPYKAGTVSTYISRFLHGLGIDASAHRARHWYGTACWAASKDLLVTQQLLRHASPRTSQMYCAFDASLATEVVRNLSLNGHQERLL